MKHSIAHYQFIAELFDYPDQNFPEKTARVQAFLNEKYPEAAGILKPFTDFTSGATLIEIQELFIRSFDVQAVTTLDLGYVMFGDDYKRGELLVNLNREHREVKNECGTELADYLANVLRLLPKMEDGALVAELVSRIIAPSLRKMIRGFEPDQVELKDKFYKRKHKTVIDRPIADYIIYQRTLKVLYLVLKSDFGFEEREPVEKTSDFLKSIHTEINLEGT